MRNLFISINPETAELTSNDKFVHTGHPTIRVEIGDNDFAPRSANIVPINGLYEPTFTLMAHDNLSSVFVRHYATLLEATEPEKREKIISCRGVATAMDHWAGRNKGDSVTKPNPKEMPFLDKTNTEE